MSVVTSQMQAKEARAREARRRELEELVVKREADALFARNEEEKRNRRFNELKQLQGTHLKQAVSTTLSPYAIASQRLYDNRSHSSCYDVAVFV